MKKLIIQVVKEVRSCNLVTNKHDTQNVVIYAVSNTCLDAVPIREHRNLLTRQNSELILMKFLYVIFYNVYKAYSVHSQLDVPVEVITTGAGFRGVLKGHRPKGPP